MQIAVNFKNDETEILNNFQEGLREVKLIKNQLLNSRPVEELLNEL